MNKQMSNSFYDERNIYLIIRFFIKCFKHFISFIKSFLVNKIKCLIHNKYLNSNFQLKMAKMFQKNLPQKKKKLRAITVGRPP